MLLRVSHKSAVVTAAMMSIAMLAGCQQKGSVSGDDSESSSTAETSKAEPSGEASREFEGEIEKDGWTYLDEVVVLEGDYEFEWSVEGNSYDEDVDGSFEWVITNENDRDVRVVSEHVGERSGSETVADIYPGGYRISVYALKGAKWQVKLSRIS